MKTAFLTGVLGLLLGEAWAQDAKPRTMEEMHKLHQNSGALMAVLEDPKRDEYR